MVRRWDKSLGKDLEPETEIPLRRDMGPETGVPPPVDRQTLAKIVPSRRTTYAGGNQEPTSLQL